MYTDSMEDSIFTKIIKGEIPCHKIYEDEKTIAFLDIHPQTPGHTLVVPKAQVDHIWDLDDEEYGHLMRTVKRVGQRLRQFTDRKRVGVIVAGYGVPHTHVHLIPMKDEAELKAFQNLDSPVDQDALSRIAQELSFQ